MNIYYKKKENFSKNKSCILNQCFLIKYSKITEMLKEIQVLTIFFPQNKH